MSDSNSEEKEMKAGCRIVDVSSAIRHIGAQMSNHPRRPQGQAETPFAVKAGTSAGAYPQWHNLQKLTLTATPNYVIPVFPPWC